MRAITVVPGRPDSLRLDERPDPAAGADDVLVEVLAVGICGTDHEVVGGAHGVAPPGSDRLVLGHESVGRVRSAPAASGLDEGDLVVGIVRRPDPVPCVNCAVGEWDMCRNGRYTEHGIRGADGYACERIVLDPAFAVPVDPALGVLGVLTEPTSVVEKAWEHVERIGSRARWEPRRALVTGAGPVGLLAAMLGVQRGLEVHVLDRVADGPKPDLVEALGAHYHHDGLARAGVEADVVIECTGVPSLVFEAIRHNAQDAIVCLTGVSTGGRSLEVPAGAIARDLVLENDVVFGSVNANRRHYDHAASALAAADRDWLDALVTSRVPLEQWTRAYAERDPHHDVKTILTLG